MIAHGINALRSPCQVVEETYEGEAVFSKMVINVCLMTWTR